jgi:YVTN family beta-propeller protein
MSIKGKLSHVLDSEDDDDQQPYIGPRAFRTVEADRLRFSGRDTEIDEIVALIASHRIVLIYAQSGAGKTSIINAGVIPSLVKEGFEVLPVARVQVTSLTSPVSPKNGNNNIPSKVENSYICNALQSLGREKPEITPESFSDLALFEFLDRYFPTRKNENEEIRPQVLIFDQLEELFSFYPDNWIQQQRGFFQEVADSLDNNPFLRVVFVIREDFLAQLDPFRSILPEKLRARFRLEPLRRREATSAIKKPLKKVLEKATEDEKANIESEINALVNELRKMNVEVSSGDTRPLEGEFIEPIQLQVVCRRWWREREAFKRLRHKITSPEELVSREKALEELVSGEKALEDFYEDAILTASQQTGMHESKIRIWCQQKLITSSGTRSMVHRGQKTTEGIDNNVIDWLVRKYLIRKEHRSGASWYELTHDRLIKPIISSNAKWKVVNDRKKNRKIIITSGLAVAAATIIVMYAILASWNTIFPSACPEEGSQPMQPAELDQYPSSMTFNPENDRLYVVNNVDKAREISGATTDSDNSSITIICANNNQEIIDESIPGMAGVSGVAVNSNTNTIYVANNSSNTVSVMHGESPSITETAFNTEPKNIGVGGSPMGVAVDADRNKAYVVNEKSKTVSVIDEDTKIGQDIKLEHSPTSIAVNPKTNKVYVSSYENNTVYVIDGNRNTIEDSIKVGINPTAIAVNPNTNMIYVVNRFSDSVSVINGNANNQVIERVVGQDPLDIAINLRNNMVYVVNNQSLSISVINGTSSGDNNVIQTISLAEHLSPDLPDLIRYDPTSIEINPDTNMLFITMADRSLQEHRVESLLVRDIHGYGDELPLLGDWPRGLALDAQKDRLYVTNTRSNTISVVDTRNNVVRETIPVGEKPSDVVIDQGKERIYVINCDSNNTSIVDTRQNVKIKDIDVGKCPWSIAQDPDYNMIYVANLKDSTVSVINSSTTEVVKTIAVDKYPTDIWINPESHLVYVTDSNSMNVIKPVLSSAREPSFPILANITAPSNSVFYPVSVAVDNNMDEAYAYVANKNSSSISVVDEEEAAIFDQVQIPFPSVVTVDTNDHIVYALAGYWPPKLIGKSLPYEIYKMNASGTVPAEVSLIRTWEKFATQLGDLEVDPDSGTIYATNMQSNSLKIIQPADDLGSISDLQNRELYRLGK